jgi:hypothetical protein
MLSAVFEVRGMSRFNLRFPSMVLMLVVGALAAPTLRGQDSQPSAAEAPTIPYLDKALGFELQVPAGWNYDRTGFFGPGGSFGLLRGLAPDGRTILQILVFRELQMPKFPEWVEFFSKQLGSISGTEQVRVKGEPSGQRPAAYVIVDAKFGIDRTRTLYYCVQFDASTVWVFSYAIARVSALGDREDKAVGPPTEVAVPDEFLRLAKTLRVFYDPAVAEQMAVALQRGKDYLARYQLQEDINKLDIDEAVRHYEIRLARKPIGYMTRQFTYETEPLQRPGQVSNAKEGLRVRERSYRFADDGTVHFSKIDLFSSRDAETDVYELWQARIPPPDSAGREPVITRDQCVREGDTLFSTYTTSQDRGLPEPRRPIKVEPAYLGLAWARLLPALLGPEPQPMCAFTIYDPETRTLITHAIKLLGKRALPGFSGKEACVYENREGFAEQVGLVFTNAHGTLLRFEAGDLVFKLSDEATIEKRFGRRRDAANARLGHRP